MADLRIGELPAGYFLSFPFGATNVSRPLDPAGSIRLGGWSLVETTNAAVATVELWDGSVNGGGTLAVINLAAGQSLTKSMPGLGLVLRSGLFLNVTAGTVRGAIWAAATQPAAVHLTEPEIHQ